MSFYQFESAERLLRIPPWIRAVNNALGCGLLSVIIYFRASRAIRLQTRCLPSRVCAARDCSHGVSTLLAYRENGKYHIERSFLIVGRYNLFQSTPFFFLSVNCMKLNMFQCTAVRSLNKACVSMLILIRIAVTTRTIVRQLDSTAAGQLGHVR